MNVRRMFFGMTKVKLEASSLTSSLETGNQEPRFDQFYKIYTQETLLKLTENVLHSKRQVRSRNSPDTPVRLGREHLVLVVRGRNGLDFVSVDVGRLGLNRSDLSLGLG